MNNDIKFYENKNVCLLKKKLKPFLEINNLTKYLNGNNIIDNINLKIYKGEIFSLLGPSGCGKSTLLRIIAGFESINKGKIFLNGEDISNIPPYQRKINMMFQSYALFPHMTVEQNIAFGLKQDNLKKRDIVNRVEEMLCLVRMNEHAKRKPHQLSGGQCQRVALARSLAKNPKLLLLDEPMGSLDKKLRCLMQVEIVEIIKKVGITCIMVTHDQKEAMTMSKRIGIMNNGKFEQIGLPEDIYEHPISIYTAKFIGSINIFQGQIVKKLINKILIKILGFNKIIEINHHFTSYNHDNNFINIALRPEKIELCKKLPDYVNNFAIGKIVEIIYLGDFSIYHVYLKNEQKIIIQIQNGSNFRKTKEKMFLNDVVYIYCDVNDFIILNI